MRNILDQIIKDKVLILLVALMFIFIGVAIYTVTSIPDKNEHDFLDGDILQKITNEDNTIKEIINRK